MGRPGWCEGLGLLRWGEDLGDPRGEGGEVKVPDFKVR